MTAGGKDRRQHARLAFAVDVDINSGTNFYSGRTRDLSRGGLFVDTDVGLPVGAQLLLMVHVAGKAFQIPGEVAWVLEGDAGETVGLGVRFLELSAEARAAIDAFMDKRAPMPFDMLESERPGAPGKKGPPPLPGKG